MKLVVLLLSLLAPYSHGQEYTCKWYGTCYNAGTNSFTCQYEGQPIGFNSSESAAIEVLERRCPHLLRDENGNRIPYDELVTCCSMDQLVEMDEALSVVDGILGRCPACVQNFMTSVCEYSCSPQQSRFMESFTTVSPEGIEYVDRIDVKMNADYMDSVFDSCSNVMMAQMGLPAVNIMCGSAPVCDSVAWFAYQGDPSSPYVHMEINFLRVNTTDDAVNVPTLKCSEAPEGSFPCSCSDCFESCPTDYEPDVVQPYCQVLSMNCVSFSIGLTVLVVLLSLFASLTILDYFKFEKKVHSRSKKSKDGFSNPGFMSSHFSSFFGWLGEFCAGNSMLVIMLTSWFCFGLMYGIKDLEFTTDPMQLWSSPTSQVRQELAYYEERFEPFYRTTQVFFTVVGRENFVSADNITYGPAFYLDAIKEFINLEKDIINIGRDDGGVVLEDVCVDPIRTRSQEPDLAYCTVMSVSTYLGYDTDNFNEDTYLNRMQACMNNYFDPTCLADWGGGSDPLLALGGFVDGNPQLSNTLVVSFPLRNRKSDPEFIRKAMEWELKFLELVKDYEKNRKPDYVDLAYGAERSIEDEIEDISQGEAVTLIISYVLMFIYVMINLGKIKKLKTFLEDSQIMVALASILLVVLAIGCSLGILGYLGIPLTLLVLNILPFFILSVGVDNIFIMVNTLYIERQEFKKSEAYATKTFEERKKIIFGRMMSKVGPSIIATSFSQLCCFAIGTIFDIPIVYAFALCASLTLFILFLFQITTSVAILSLDYTRSEDKRLDVFCCVQQKYLDDENPLLDPDEYKGLAQKLIEIYAEFLFKWQVKIIVAIIFVGFLVFSIIVSPHLEVGLDQETALHHESYARKYLIAVATLLEQGAPVYFVVTAGLNMTNTEHQNVICGGILCDDDSLYTQVYLSSLYSDETYIAAPSNSWLDDYFDWSSLPGTCCKYNIEDNSFCETANSSSACAYCSIELDSFGLRPNPDEFEIYLPWFLRDNPTDVCPKGGAASYAEAVNYIFDDFGHAIVQETSFMAYHTALRSSQDYYEAYGYARKISDNITATIHRKTGLTDVKVFPFAVFYPFYEFYLTMWQDTTLLLTYSLLAVLGINLIMSSFNIFTTFAIMITLIMILVDMFGLMYLWSIPLNPVSLVNLVVSIGIGVEFCSHTIQAYITSTKDIRERSKDALINMGSNVVNGITLTNIPIVVLAFSYTELVQVMFFRMFFGLVIIGFLHGIVFLPVLLSFMSNVFSYKGKKNLVDLK